MNKEEIEKLKKEDFIYNKTQKFGRTQFVRELARLEEENKQLKEINEEHHKLNGELRKTINKAIEYIEKYQTEYEDVSTGINIKMIETWKVLEILKGE